MSSQELHGKGHHQEIPDAGEMDIKSEPELVPKEEISTSLDLQDDNSKKNRKSGKKYERKSSKKKGDSGVKTSLSVHCKNQRRQQTSKDNFTRNFNLQTFSATQQLSKSVLGRKEVAQQIPVSNLKDTITEENSGIHFSQITPVIHKISKLPIYASTGDKKTLWANSSSLQNIATSPSTSKYFENVDKTQNSQVNLNSTNPRLVSDFHSDKVCSSAAPPISKVCWNVDKTSETKPSRRQSILVKSEDCLNSIVKRETSNKPGESKAGSKVMEAEKRKLASLPTWVSVYKAGDHVSASRLISYELQELIAEKNKRMRVENKTPTSTTSSMTNNEK